MVARVLRARTLDLAKDAVGVHVAAAHAPQHEGQPAKFHRPGGVPRGTKGTEQLLQLSLVQTHARGRARTGWLFLFVFHVGKISGHFIDGTRLRNPP